MLVLALKRLRKFWPRPGNEEAQGPLRLWHAVACAATWENFAGVRRTFGAADAFENKVIFDVGGNKFRLIAVVDHEHHRVFVRAVLTHQEDEEGKWILDSVGKDGGKKKKAAAPKRPPRKRRR